MTNREDQEYNKFWLTWWLVGLKAVPGVAPGTALLTWTLDELESKKFTPAWKVRYIVTF